MASSASGQVRSAQVTILPLADGSAVGELRFRERQVNGVNYLGLRAPDSISANGFCRFPLNCDGLGQSLTIIGSGTSNGNIVLQPGNVAANASVFVETPRVDVAGLIIRDPAGTTTGNSFEIRKNDNTIYFKCIGGTDAGAPGTCVGRDFVPFDDVTWKLGNITHRWNQYFGHDMDVTGLSYFHRNSSGNSVVRVENSNTAGYSAVEFLDSSASSKGLVGFANGSAVVGPSTFLIGTNGANPISFYTNGSIYFRMTTAGGLLGNLTSTDVSYSPGAFISSQGFYSASATTNASVGSFSAIGGSYVAIGSNHTGSGTDLPIAIFTNSAERFRITVDGGLYGNLTSTDVSYNAGAIISKDAFVSATAATNASIGSFAAIASNYVAVASSKTGSGTYLPLAFFTSASKRWEIDTSGNFLPGTTGAYTLGSSSLRPLVVYADIINATNGITTSSGNFTGVLSVRDSGGVSDCTISINGGVIYASTC